MKKNVSEEKKQHSSKWIPYSYYDCRIPELFSEVQMHWHNEFEINYIINGNSIFICGDEKFVAHTGDIIILPPNMLHAISSYENQTQFYHTFVFSPDMLGASENDRCTVECILPIINELFGMNVHITASHSRYHELKRSVETIFECIHQNTALSDMLIKSELLRIFWILENHGDIYRKKEAETSRSEIIRPALEFINDNFRDNITIEQLADVVHLSKSYFMGRFHEVTGTGALEYIIRKRLKYACDLLLKTGKTTAEIAFESGFRNLSNFNRQFSRIVGCTPREYRKQDKSLITF